MSRYMSVKLSGSRVWILSSRRESIRDVDAVVFDCDGVLVDTRRSYDATILKVVEAMLTHLIGLRLPWARMGPPLIRMLRRTGGFNNDWNVTYALIVFSALSARSGRDGKPSAREVVRRIFKMTEAFCSSGPGIGHVGVDEFVVIRELDVEARVMRRLRESLGYPGSPPVSAMATLFDEVYHGGKLFREMYGFAARQHRGRGMIERDRLVIRERELRRLSRLVGRNMAIATGRPALAAKHSLGKLLDYFDPGASVFMGEADVHPEIARDYEKYQKPSGYSLVRARQLFASDTLLYVGDSEEDRLMVENARSAGEEGFLFAGIYGTSGDMDGQVRYLKRKDADIILKSVNQVPSVMGMARE